MYSKDAHYTSFYIRDIKKVSLASSLIEQLRNIGLLFFFFQPISECQLSDSDSEGQKGRLFHRSVSMGTSGVPWSKREGDARVILARKRNNSSSGEVTTGTCLLNQLFVFYSCFLPTVPNFCSEGGSSLLCYPSATLQKLVPGLDQSAIISNEGRVTLDLLRRPSISFILRRHPLVALRLAMKHALRKATCRYCLFYLFNVVKAEYNKMRFRVLKRYNG